jgi:hypothetical protein
MDDREMFDGFCPHTCPDDPNVPCRPDWLEKKHHDLFDEVTSDEQLEKRSGRKVPALIAKTVKARAITLHTNAEEPTESPRIRHAAFISLCREMR